MSRLTNKKVNAQQHQTMLSHRFTYFMRMTLVAASSSDPSILSKVLALATGDLGEFGLINPTRLLELERTICLLPVLIMKCYCIIINSTEKRA
jgi:hypothetical protein